MKKKARNLFLIFITVAGLNVSGSEISKKFMVLGQCGMCQNRIEETAKKLDGVKSARWDQSNQSLTVSFDELQTSLQKIQTAITMKGHDTELFSASDVRYNNLPDCCKYKRDETKKTNVHGTGNPLLQNMMPASTECVHDKSPTEGSCCEK